MRDDGGKSLAQPDNPVHCRYLGRGLRACGWVTQVYLLADRTQLTDLVEQRRSQRLQLTVKIVMFDQAYDDARSPIVLICEGTAVK